MADGRSKKSVLVVGGTGTQGSSLARALLADKEQRYSVRVLTRRPSGTTAQQLQKLGAELHAGDLGVDDDKESIYQALDGVDTIFLNTIHDVENGDWRDELQLGMNFIEMLEDTVKARGSAQGVDKPLVVYSTLPSLSEIVDDETADLLTEYKPKFQIEERLRKSTLVDSLFVFPGCFAENFQNIFPPNRKHVFFGPLEHWWLQRKETVFPSIVMKQDFGRAVGALMERKSEFLRRHPEPIHLSTEFLTLDEELRMIGKAVNEDIQHNPFSAQELSALPNKERADVEFHSAGLPKEIMDKFQNDQKLTLELLENEFDSFEEWCLKNKEGLRTGNRALGMIRNTVKATASFQKNWPYLLAITIAVAGGYMLRGANKKKA